MFLPGVWRVSASPNAESVVPHFSIMLSRDACGSKKTVAREISFGKDKGGITDVATGRCVALRLAQSRRTALTATTCPNTGLRSRRLVYAHEKGAPYSFMSAQAAGVNKRAGARTFPRAESM